MSDVSGGESIDHGEPVDPAFRSWAAQENWRAKRLRPGHRMLIASIFLLYLAQTAGGVATYAHGALEVVGFVMLGAFIATYVISMPLMWREPESRLIWFPIAVMAVLYAVETPIARDDAYVMAVFVTVMLIQAAGRYWLPIIAALTLSAMVLPTLVPGWHEGINWSAAVSIPLVAGIMFGFFKVTEANRELVAMRAEVVRLAAESERNRIARDLHDVLGHSLTTITLKAGLAARLADRDPAQATREIAEVEQLARQALADVRATVDGYRDVTLAGELATSREVLRSAGIAADLPHSTEPVRPELQSLFGWVLREAVTNVVRHSRATSCSATWGPSWIEVVDNGVAAGTAAGNGLQGMQERVDAWGGTLRFGPGDGGWVLHVEVTRDRPVGASGDGSDPDRGADATVHAAP